jgi:hypothetical protein
MPSPAWLTSKLSTLLGADLIGLWLGDDAVVDGSSDVTSLPERVGAALNNGGAGKFKTSLLYGRRGLLGVAGQLSRLQATLASAVKTIYVACQTPEIVTPGYFNILDSTAGADTGAIQVNTSVGQRALYTGGGWTHYVDGVASENVPVPGSKAVCTIEANKAANTATTIWVGHTGGDYSWKAPMPLIMALSSGFASAAVRADVNAICRKYCVFPPA